MECVARQTFLGPSPEPWYYINPSRLRIYTVAYGQKDGKVAIMPDSTTVWDLTAPPPAEGDSVLFGPTPIQRVSALLQSRLSWTPGDGRPFRADDADWKAADPRWDFRRMWEYYLASRGPGKPLCWALFGDTGWIPSQ